VPIGLFELPDGGFVRRFLGDGHTGAKRQEQAYTHSLHFQEGRPITRMEIGWWFDCMGSRSGNYTLLSGFPRLRLVLETNRLGC
jgi:hypothetical protein